MICVPQVYYVGSALEGVCVCSWNLDPLPKGWEFEGSTQYLQCSQACSVLQRSCLESVGVNLLVWGSLFSCAPHSWCCCLLGFPRITVVPCMCWWYEFFYEFFLQFIIHCLSSAAWANLGMPHLEVPSTWCIHGCSVFHPGLWLWHSFILAILLSIARRAWGFWTFVAEPVLWSFHVLAPVVSVSSYGQLIIPAGYLMTGRTNVLMAWILFLMFNWFLSTCLTF